MSNYRLPPRASVTRDAHSHDHDHDPAGSHQAGISRRGFFGASTAGVAAGTLAGSGLIGTALADDFQRGPRRPPRGRRVLIKGGVVLTMDPGVGDFEEADVLIDGARIAEVRPNIRADAQVVDASGMIVMPGFIDTHHHMYQSVFRNVIANGTYGSGVRPNPDSDYLRDIAGLLTPLYRPEDAYAGVLVARLGQLFQGVTTSIDTSQVSHTPEHSDACIEALVESGCRSVYAYSSGSAETGGAAYAFPQDIFRLQSEHFTSNDQLVTLFLNGGIDPELVNLARSIDVPLIGHFSQSVGRLIEPHSAGLLGPDMTYVHCTRMLDEEFQIIADTGGHVSIAGPIEMTMGHGVPPYQQCLDHGIKPSLSVDTEVTMTADSFTQMRTALCLQRMLLHNRARDGETDLPPLLTCREVIEMATVAGAKACQLDHKIGTLTPGKEADIIMLSMNQINIVPVNNAYGAVVTGMDASNVVHVFAAGKLMKWHGKLVGVDVDQVGRLVTASRDHILAQTDWPRSILDTSIPGH